MRNLSRASHRYLLPAIILSILLLFQAAATSQDPIRIMPLGNSITYGNYHPEIRPEGLITGYRQSLWLMLQDAGYNIDFVGTRATGADAVPAFDPDNEGYPGWTDEQIEDNVFDWLWYNPADVVILHIGTNGLDPDPSDVAGILDEIDRYESTYGLPIKVIMAKIINRSTYSQLTTQFNQNIEKMALDRVISDGDDIVVIDMEFETDIDYRLSSSGGEMSDNLHPFVGGHEKMAVRWFEALLEVLPRPDQKPYITSDPNPFTTVGEPYVYQAQSDGLPSPSYSLLEAPAGMTIHATSGLLSWTPASSGGNMATVLAQNSFGTDTQSVEIFVREPDTRIKDGLVALYTYNEGGGNLVHDVSGVGMPNDLYINYEGNVSWDNDQGLEITSEAILIPSDMNRKVIDSCMASNAISMEAWIRTGNLEQGGPAHIMGITDPLGTGITLSQDFGYTDVPEYFFTRSLHTSTSNPDGSPALNSDQEFGSIALQHLVYSRDVDGSETFYINGEVAGTGTRSGDFSTWNEHTYKLALCNSLGFENAWTGKLFLTAIYNSALTAQQVQQNYDAGFGNQPTPVLPEQPMELGSSALSAVAAKLTWKDMSDDETGFVVERKEGSGSYHYAASVASDATEFVDAGLSANTSYTYRIKALNDYGESPTSNETSVKTFSDDFLSNVSWNKTATQSSTIYGGNADLAIDGDTNGEFGNGSVTHTAYELNAWWEVDLEGVYNINYIEVWNRIDICCKDRMARFNIFVSEEPFESYDFQTTINQAGVWTVYEDRYPEPMVRFNVAKKGRYIRLQLSDSQEICLAELIAMGSSHLEPPVFTTTPGTEGTQDQEYSYVCDATDPDADSLAFTIIQKPSWLVFNPVTRTLSGTPGETHTGSHPVTINVYDGLYNVEQSFTLVIENQNDPPVITSDPVLEVNKNVNYSYPVLVDDPDNDPLTIEILNKPAWLLFEETTWVLHGIPANSDVGLHDVTIRVSDGILTDEQIFQINVLDTNTSPVFTSNPVTEVNQGMLYSYVIAATDPDNDTLIYTVPVKPEWLSFDSGSNTLSGVPDQEHVGDIQITVRVSDGTIETDQEFQITVLDVNVLPEILSSPILTVYEDAVYGYNFVANDLDGDPITYTAVQLPDWLTFNVALLLISGTPVNEDVGIHDVKIRVSDGLGHTDQEFQVTVINVNDPLLFTSVPPDSEVWPDQFYQYDITTDDVDDGAVLTITGDTLPAWLTLIPASNLATLSGTPSLSDVGNHTISISVSDGIEKVSQDYSIEVLAPTGIDVSRGLIERIYPIPADEMVYFEFTQKGDVVVKLHDITGTVLREVQEKNSDFLKLDISDLPSNLYFYRITMNGKTNVGKLIKE